MTGIETIRERRQNAVKRALGVLEVCKTADAETRGSMLKSVVPSLTDPAVVSAWIALTASEQDANIRRNMIRSLASVDFRQIQDLPVCITLLVSCINDPDSRDWALDALSRLAPADPAVIDPLITIYEKQRSAKDQREILSALCQREEFPPQLCAFMISKLDTFDADFKTYVIARLLSQDALPTANCEKLLVPSEPSRIKLVVMEHIADRSLELDKALTTVLQSDKDSACRLEAIWLLTERGELSPDCVATILKAAMADPAPKVRENALLSFEHTLNKSPRVIEFLLQALDKETRPEYVRLILHLTMPHLQRHSGIIEAYKRFLSRNLDSNLAAEFYEALSKATAWMPQLVDALIASYTNEKDDRTKAVLLKALANVVAQDQRLVQIYVDALKLPEPQIQQWGIDGLMMLPLSEKNSATIAEMTAVLLIQKIPYELRLAAAKKIAHIPDKPKALLARLKEVAEQARESELARVCEQACVAAAATTEADNSQWDSWIHLADVEHRAEGIFPAIYTEYPKAPDKAQRVLKALLNPKCIDSLYSTYGYEVNEHTILNFLGKRRAVDDEVSQYCLSRILGGAEGSLESYLRCLIANPKFPALKSNAWTLFERGGGSSALLRELLTAAFGGIEAAGSALAERISKPMPPATLNKYIKLLTENVGWPPSKALLKQLSQRKDLSVEASKQINDALGKFGETPDASAAGPGFADE